MARPRGKIDYTRRLKAFEMFAAGVKKKDIARELGVTPAAVGNWAYKDKWSERLDIMVSRAEEAINHAVGNKIAATLDYLRDQMAARVKELEALCSPTQPAATRLQAIKLWLMLAGVNRAMPSPVDPTTPKSLELIEDLLHKETADELPQEPVQSNP